MAEERMDITLQARKCCLLMQTTRFFFNIYRLFKICSYVYVNVFTFMQCVIVECLQCRYGFMLSCRSSATDDQMDKERQTAAC